MSDTHDSAPGDPPRPEPAPRPNIDISGHVGGDVAGGDLHKEQRAGRDIVGRDVVTNTTTNATTTNVGFSAAAVLRIALSVGALVAATAACFFVLGTASALGVVAVLSASRNNNDPAAATLFGQQVTTITSLPKGASYSFVFSDTALSSYLHLDLEPGRLHGVIEDGQARLLDADHLVIAGNTPLLGGRKFASIYTWQTNQPGAPLRMTGALVQVIPFDNSALGWVAVPTALLGQVESTVNGLFGDVMLTGVQPRLADHGWKIDLVKQ